MTIPPHHPPHHHLAGSTPSVFLAGAGPLAASLAGALRRSGVPVLGIWARRSEAARWAAAFSGVAAFAGTPPDLARAADALVVAVADDAVSAVAGLFADSGCLTARQVLLKCSGAWSVAETFGDLAEKVAGAGTLHPLLAIVDPAQATMSMQGVAFGVEGDEAGKTMAKELVRLLGGTAIEIQSAAMPLYHAAAVIVSNYTVVLADAARAVLVAAGVPEDQGVPAVIPLLRSTVANLANAGLPQALTGPIARGDAGTVAKHLAALRAHPDTTIETLYRLLGQRAAAVARRKGSATDEALGRIEEALARVKIE
ncbi:MAG: DUF2520 domain-containing protein [Pseudomonadota bacterium]